MLSEKKSEKEKYVQYHLFVESKKYKKIVSITKKEQIHRYGEQTSGNNKEREEGRGKTSVGKWEAQTIGSKIGYKMHCTTWAIQPIFCSTVNGVWPLRIAEKIF